MSENISHYFSIFNHQLLNKIIDDMTYNQFLDGKNTAYPQIPIDFDELKKCIWLASILASSPAEVHRKKVQLFASLAYLRYKGDLNIEKACFLILSRVGNLIATRLFDGFSSIGQEDSIYSFDSLLDIELAHEWNDKLLSISNENILTSKFQKELWDGLAEKKRLSISAPTSAGKSFIIKKHIVNELQNKSEFKVLYIVPSKALINQVSEEFRKEFGLNSVDIKTAFLEDSLFALNKKEIYVLTPERCLRLLQYSKTFGLNLDIIFVDEVQNIEDVQGRGSLFEHILKELYATFTNAQLIIAGPNISNTSVLYNSVFGVASHTIETNVSPVFQIKVILRPLRDNVIKVSIQALAKEEISFDLPVNFDLRKGFNKNYGTGIRQVIDYFSNNEQSIIFSPKTDSAEDWALEYVTGSNNLPDATEQETSDLIEFLRDEIHPKYYLIKCLEKKVAFHHSKLPDIVRKEIEDGYLEKRLTNLFCTSTLIEGVNLPANNLFVVSAKKLNEELSKFEFGNLIGRAGRIKDSLYGTIYCIEKNQSDVWAEDYYETSHQKEVKSVSQKSIADYDNFIKHLDMQNLDADIVPMHVNTVIFLRHKFLNDKESLNEYLLEKGLSTGQINYIITKLSDSLSNLSIPVEISKKNPSIDPVLQNRLYLQILEEGVDKWAITKKEDRNINRDNQYLFSFRDTTTFWQLVSVMSRIDEIFKVRDEAFLKQKIKTSIRQVCYFGIRWLNSSSYKDIIVDDIDYYSNRHPVLSERIDPNNDSHVNRRINEVIKINSTIVTYILVKYIKLVNDMLEPLMSDDDKERYKYSLALPTMLELGSNEPVIKLLISKGISRSVALKVWGEFRKVRGYEDLDVFAWMASKDKLSLKPIYNRYLKRLRMLKD